MNSMDLRALQRQFKQALLSNETDGLFAAIRTADEADKQARLDIYRNNVVGSCLRAIEQAYPVCRQVVGKTNFSRAARGYVLTHPSRCGNLNTYGDQFVDFLTLLCEQEKALRPFPFMPDLARLEWAYHRTYDSADDSVFDYHALSEIEAESYDRIVFVLGAAVSPIKSHYTVAALWRGDKDEPERQTQYLCVYRRHLSPAVAIIDKTRYRLLTMTAAETSLADLAAAFPALDKLLPEMIQQRYICGIRELSQ